MLTLQELKQIVAVPNPGQRAPTARNLKTSETIIAKVRLNRNVEVAAYQSGYALYQIDKRTTVFPISSCREYLYEKSEKAVPIPERFFEQEIWYMRLVLEGEDRLMRNADTREQGKNTSYSAISEEWAALEDMTESVLECLMIQETVEELLSLLTEKQRVIVQQFYLNQKTQKQISRELGITTSAVSRILSQALQRLRKGCITSKNPECLFPHQQGRGA